MLIAFTSGDLWRVALSIFLLAVGLTLGFVFLRLAGTVRRLTSFVKGAEDEVLPVINKIGGSVDRVNDQLDKVDLITDSAVDAVESADTAVRAVSFAITKPVQKITGFAAGVSYGAADFKSRRNWRSAVQAGKEAAARREHDLDEELRESAQEARRPDA